MKESSIKVRGARTHNLKNIDLDIPRDKLVVMTGLSGSGKSSLAFDTLYAEGQRRYVESLSTYARQFLSMMDKPDVDHIEGLSPAISIEQKSVSHNPRSTVGTITEIYDYMRLLYARAGTPVCPDHKTTLRAQTISQIVDNILALPKASRMMLLAPVVDNRKGSHEGLLNQLRQQGYIRIRLNGVITHLDEIETLDGKKKHSIDVVVDRLKIDPSHQQRLAESTESAVHLSEGKVIVAPMDNDFEEKLYSTKFACKVCGYSVATPEPKLFSFNSPAGACNTCDGLGMQRIISPEKIIINPEISLSGGAIYHWDKRHTYYHQLLISLSEHYGFDLDSRWKDLSEDIQKIILYGSGSERIRFNYISMKRRHVTRIRPFEGVIPAMERRYHETESAQIKEDLVKLFEHRPCQTCQGARLNLTARHVWVDGKSISQVCSFSIEDTLSMFKDVSLDSQSQKIATPILKEICDRLQFLMSVGLNYLSLDRAAETLSGGEAQRIRLASQIGSGLTGVMYVLDEPSIGLHQRDNQRLLNTLFHLRDLGNSVLVVEHDEDTIQQADYVIDIGPGAGVHGGQIIAQGPPETIRASQDSITGAYISGRESIPVPKKRLPAVEDKWLTVSGATCHNLKTVSTRFPVGVMTAVTGVSGSGKSSLVNDTLLPHLHNQLGMGNPISSGPVTSVDGVEHIDKMICIDQSPIGRTPRSNPATYTGIFTNIREIFAQVPASRERGYKPGRFSFNVRGGRCDACEGDGVIKVEMHFLADVYVVCDQCNGKRYNRETLTVHYKGKSIADVLDMTVSEACQFFDAIPAIQRKLQTLEDVGLGYIHLGQSATTLSGGEAQRIKLSRELGKRSSGQTLYILDEPTTGLHFADVKQLLQVLFRLRDQGNTVVVIEHHLDVIKSADWLIDMGPEGGTGGGEVIAEGTPETVSKVKKSHTGRFLKDMLNPAK